MHFEILVENQSGKRALDIIVPKLVSAEDTFDVKAYRGVGQGKLVHALDLSASCSDCGVSEHVGWDRGDLRMGRAC